MLTTLEVVHPVSRVATAVILPQASQSGPRNSSVLASFSSRWEGQGEDCLQSRSLLSIE
jgi:hypothetical protein